MDEVAAAAPVKVELVDAEAVHLPVTHVDEALTFAGQRVEIGWGHGALQDKEALLTKLAHLLGVMRSANGHVCPSVIVGDHMICGSAARVFADIRDFLSFIAMIDDVGVRVGLDGRVVRHKVGDVQPRAIAMQLEVNLVVRGTAWNLLGDRRYALTPGTLTWLFPGQDHVLVSESSDHELWWAVFRPTLVAQIATTRHARSLLKSWRRQVPRRLDSGWVGDLARSSTKCRTRRRWTTFFSTPGWRTC